MRVLAALGGGWRFRRFRGDWARGSAVAARFGEGFGVSGGVTASVFAGRGLGGPG